MNPRDWRILESAVRNEETLAAVTPAAAVNFGVLPIHVDDKKVILAFVRQGNADCLKMLARYFKKDLQVVPVDAEILVPYIRRAYEAGGFINHHTFLTADSILAEENMEMMMSSKIDKPALVGSELAPSVRGFPRNYL